MFWIFPAVGLLLVVAHGNFEPCTSMALCCGKHNMVMFPAVELFLAATFGDIEPYTSMASCGCHPIFQHKTTIVEKSGLVAPDFFRQHEAVCHGTLEIQMFALGKTRRTNFPFRQTKEGSTVLALPSEGLQINCQESFWNP